MHDDELRIADTDANARADAIAQAHLDEVEQLLGRLVAGASPRSLAAARAYGHSLDLQWQSELWIVSSTVASVDSVRSMVSSRVSSPRHAVRIIVDPTAVPSTCSILCSCSAASEARCAHAFAVLLALDDHIDNAASPLRVAMLRSFGRESWRRALQGIEQIVDDQRRANDSSPLTETPSLSFRVAPHRSQARISITIRAFHHPPRAGQDGGRSAGRRLRWGDWLEHPAWRETGIGRALHTLAPSSLSATTSGERKKPFDEMFSTGALLEALIGYPAVYWDDAPRRRVQIDRGWLTVHIDKVRGGASLRLAMSPPMKTLSARDSLLLPRGRVVDIDDNHNTITVSQQLSSQLLEVVRLLMHCSGSFPLDRLESVVGQLAGLLDHQEHDVLVLDPALVGSRVCGVTTAVLQLEMLAGGALQIRICVRPHAASGKFVPGLGPRQLQIVVDGSITAVERNIDAERQRCHHLAACLDLSVGDDSDEPAANWGWCLVDRQDALAVVAKLRAINGDDLHVEWASPAPRFHTPLDHSMLELRIRHKRDWFAIEGTLTATAGNHIAAQLQLPTLFELARTRTRFVEIEPGQWAPLTDRLLAMIGSLELMTETGRGGLKLRDEAHFVLDDLFGEHIEKQSRVDWQSKIVALHGWAEFPRRSPSAEPLALAGVQATLRDYQREGVAWLTRLSAWGVGACLADDMGLGKTLQSLVLLHNRRAAGPALVVTPLSVVHNWQAECERFTPTLRCLSYRDGDRAQILEDCGPGDVVVINFALLQRDVSELEKREWATFVIDEAQFVKNPQTKTARAARSIRAHWKLALTGTPLENRIGDLWSLFRLLNPGLLGSIERFHDHYVVPIERYADSRRRRSLAQVVRPFILRRTKAQVLPELPPRIDTTHHIEFGAEQAKLYERYRRRIQSELREQGNRADRRLTILQGLTTLRQLACHPALVEPEWTGGSAKVDFLVQMIRELASAGHRALIFSQFTRFLDLIESSLNKEDLTHLRIDGKVPPDLRRQRVAAFQRDEVDSMLISLKAGGTGLNLTRATYVFHMDPWWNPATEEQASGRAHRIGQEHSVHVYRLIAKQSVEERMLDMHRTKSELAESLLEGTSQAGKLDVEELADLIRVASS